MERFQHHARDGGLGSLCRGFPRLFLVGHFWLRFHQISYFFKLRSIGISPVYEVMGGGSLVCIL